MGYLRLRIALGDRPVSPEAAKLEAEKALHALKRSRADLASGILLLR